MSNISTIGSPPIMVHNIENHKKSHPLEFPVHNDITILQSPTDCPGGRFDWKVLKTLRSALNLGQITAAIVILVLTQIRARRHTDPLDSLPEITYIFLAINALIGTVLLLADSIVKAHPLRRAFTPVLWFQVELWFTGLAVVAFHSLAYSVLVMSLNYYGIGVNRVAAAFGFINAGLYLASWWINFSKRVHNLEKNKIFSIKFPTNYDIPIVQSPASPAGRFKWRALKTVKSGLKLGQIVASILTLVFIRPRSSYYSEQFFWPELPYFIVAFTAILGSVVLLCDSILEAQPHRRAFSPLEWFRVNLWYTGLTTVTFYTVAFSVFVMALWDIRSCSFNIWAAVFGFVAAALYAADWWINFCKRCEFGDKPKAEDNGKPNQ